MELKTVWVNELNALQLQAFIDAGYRPDPVLMPTGRPNVVEGVGAIYHLIKLPEDKAKATEELIDYFRSQPATDWAMLAMKQAVVDKIEAHILELRLAAENPLPLPEEDVILGTVYVEHGKDQTELKNQGYFVAHKDHITAKGTIMSQMGKRPKPVSPPGDGAPPSEVKQF
jgi:hypothetical protein